MLEIAPFELSLRNELEVEQLRFENEWLFQWHKLNMEGKTINVDRFDGGRIMLGGWDQQQTIYWQAIGRYLTEKVHSPFKTWNQETKEYPTEIRQSSLEGASRAVAMFVSGVFRRATDTDQAVRGKGRPKTDIPYQRPAVETRVRAELTQLTEVHGELLRSVFTKETRFARAEQMQRKEKWITAAEAVRLLKPVFNSDYMAQQTICKRAHGGLVRARAEKFVMGRSSQRNFEIPKEFWWAEGGTALQQNWPAGDFDTWIDRGEVHLQAFGVSFLRADIERMIPADMPTPPKSPAVPIGGRPPADWWEDLLIEVCFRHFRGELQPKTQADIARSMQQWIMEHGYDAADSTIKIRARKVWNAIKRDAEN